MVVPATFDWDDVGAWPAVAKHFKCDEAGNVARGDVLTEQCSGNIVFTEKGHVVTLLGVSDLVVVHTADATLVMPKAKKRRTHRVLTQRRGDAERKFC